MNRRLSLRKDTLTELTPGDLVDVRGGSGSFDNCITWICWPLVTAIVSAATKVPGELTVTC
jgi:hypothetical protein